MPTNPAPRKRNGRHIADQAVTLPTKTSIPVCSVDDVFNRSFNDGQHPGTGGNTNITLTTTCAATPRLPARKVPRQDPGSGGRECTPPAGIQSMS
jgi:hypothetical protein